MTGSVPSSAAAERQLQRVLESNSFRKSHKTKALLEMLVTGSLQGKPSSQQEIGIKLFGQPDQWVPDADHAIVRTNITRLNKRLTSYYKTEGANDLVIIRIKEFEPVFEYNGRSPYFPKRPRLITPEFVTSVEGYFADPDDQGIRCVVTGDLADWHHLDGDPENLSIGNLIPLCERLRSCIEHSRQYGKTNEQKDLEPRYLADTLARRHFADWRMARAYACAHLAFHMGESPLGHEIADIRILRLCDALSHVRHRFNESIVAHLIHASLLPLLVSIKSLDPRALCQLAIQLSGISDEAAYFDTAERALVLAETVAARFESLVYESGSLNRFSLLRRRAQLLMERTPIDKGFDDLASEAEEQAHHNPNLPLTLQVIVTHRWLRQATYNASKKTYEALLPNVERFKNAIFQCGSLEKPQQTDSANLAAILISSAIAACRISPKGWQEYAREMISKARLLCERTGYGLPREFSETVLTQTYEDNPEALRLSLLPSRYVMRRLRDSVRRDIETILECLEGVLVAEKADESLNWKSPWSTSRSGIPSA